MVFDTSTYTKSVLIPLSRDKARRNAIQQVIRDLQGTSGTAAAARLDIAALFAVEPGMTAQELAAHLRRLGAVFNKQQELPAAQLLKRLLDLLERAGGAVNDPTFWAVFAAERGAALKTQLTAFAQELAEEFPLKVITAEQLTEQVAAAGLTGTSGADLRAALAKHALSVHPAFEIPRGPVPAPIRKVTDFAEFRTIVDVVLRPEQPVNIAVIDELTVGNPPRRLTPDDVASAKKLLQKQEARVEENARQAAQSALAALSAYPSPAALHALTLAALAVTTEDLLRRGRTRVAVRNDLVGCGLREIDAARLVAKLSASTQVLGLDDVRERLASGALGEARRMFDTLPPLDGEDRQQRMGLAENLAAAEQRKADHLARYHAALGARRYEAAAMELRSALAIDTEDDELRQSLARLPPPQPAELSLRVDGRVLHLTWPGDGDESIRYHVVRTAGTVPVGPADGLVLASDLDATAHRDRQPPVGREVRYAVFATRDGRSFSDPTTAATTVLPVPGDLSAAPGFTDVVLSWSTPAEAVGVTVVHTAPDGSHREHHPATPGQYTVTGLGAGTRYRFAVRAIYLLPGGARRESAAAEVDATPRGAIRAVDDLRTRAAQDRLFQATWSDVAGYAVELWALPVTGAVVAGTRMSFAQLGGQGGRRLTPRPGRGTDGAITREFGPLTDVCLLVPVTVDADGGLVGTPVVAGTAPGARQPVAERFGEELRLSWEWPAGHHLMEVGWAVDGSRHRRRVSRADYNERGGVRLAPGDRVREVSLATVVRSGSREWVSPAVAVPVGGIAAKITYSLALRRSLRGRGLATVTVESARSTGPVEVLAVLKEAKFMPSTASDGRVVDRRRLDFSAEPTFRFEIDLGRVERIFWVRLFPDPDSGARIEDPPTSQLRG